MDLTRNKKIRKAWPGGGYASVYRYNLSDEKGDEILTRLRNSVDSNSDDYDQHPQSVSREYWVKYYLEEFGDEIGISIHANLDKKVSGERGDYEVVHDGDQKVLEVEKDVSDFLKHGHSTDGKSGWSDPASIDLVFAATDRNDRKSEIDVPVIVSAEQDYEDTDAPAFSQWYDRVNDIKSAKEALYYHLLNAVYSHYCKGVPSFPDFNCLAGDLDEYSLKMNKRYLTAIHSVMGDQAKLHTDSVLFDSDTESIQSEDSFSDVKERVIDSVEESYSEGESWDCPKCNQPMVALGQNRFTYEPDMQEMTEGQFAEQVAAQQGGFFEEGIHGETLTVSYCFGCLVVGAKAPRDSEAMNIDNTEPFQLPDEEN